MLHVNGCKPVLEEITQHLLYLRDSGFTDSLQLTAFLTVSATSCGETWHVAPRIGQALLPLLHAEL